MKVGLAEPSINNRGLGLGILPAAVAAASPAVSMHQVWVIAPLRNLPLAEAEPHPCPISAAGHAERGLRLGRAIDEYQY
jgi:hypothetical protein